jgi:hypothetical protein
MAKRQNAKEPVGGQCGLCKEWRWGFFGKVCWKCFGRAWELGWRQREARAQAQHQRQRGNEITARLAEGRRVAAARTATESAA